MAFTQPGNTIRLSFGTGRGPGKVSDLRYQSTEVNEAAAGSNELMFLKFRYKKPDEDQSILAEDPVYYTAVPFSQSSENFRFAAAVASFGMLLRESEFSGTSSYKSILQTGREAMGQDTEGYRKEFLNLVELASQLRR